MLITRFPQEHDSEVQFNLYKFGVGALRVSFHEVGFDGRSTMQAMIKYKVKPITKRH
jgi:hypothetical protein